MMSLSEIKQQIASLPFFSSPYYLKRRHLILPAIVLIFALLISGLVTIPQVFKLVENFKTIEELNQKKSFLQTKNSTLAGIDVELYRKNLDTALVALPVGKDIPGVAGELLSVLSGSGMTLDAISFAGSSSEISEVEEYTLKFDISGEQSNLKNFLERVKLLPRIIKMTALDISQSKANSINASITFVTLHQSLPADIGSIEQKVPELTPEDKKLLAEIEEKLKLLPRANTTGGSQPVNGKLNPFAR